MEKFTRFSKTSFKQPKTIAKATSFAISSKDTAFLE